MRRYNDYELIYLVQNEACEQALSLMISKYQLLIYKTLHLYNVNEVYFEDYVQESHILLYNIISKFDEKKGKTFTRFFELVLKRRVWYLKSIEPRYDNYESLDYFSDTKSNYDEISKVNLTSLEKNVYERYYEQNQQISFIAKMEDKSSKQIYNAIYRIKEKYTNNLL